MKHFIFNVGQARALPYDKYWEFCIASCHAATALREDYRRQLTRCRREIGFRYVRFHGLFDDDMSVIRAPEFGTEPIISFTNIDSIYDFLLSIDMKPFIELSFMPECLKEHSATLFHYRANTAPPADYDAWGQLIRRFVEHLLERYGRNEVRQWLFEVWNEPNMGPDSPNFCFWSGTKEEYFHLYLTTAKTIKAVDPFLKVGGPATSNNAWIPEMLDFCRQSGAPIDFVSTHHYPTDVVLGYGVENRLNFVKPPEDPTDEAAVKAYLEQTSVFEDALWAQVDRGVLTTMDRKAVAEAQGLPVYYTEWNSLAGLPSDGPFGASFIAKSALDGVDLAKGYAYWTFSDIFEESGMPSIPFHGGFGLLNLQGIAKAPYRAFQLLHELGSCLVRDHFSDGTVDVHVCHKDVSGALQLLLINHHSLRHPITAETVRTDLTGFDRTLPALVPCDIQRIDDNHANALAAWQAMGSPASLTRTQYHLLEAASELVRENFVLKSSDNKLSLTVDLPPMGMALVNIYL